MGSGTGVITFYMYTFLFSSPVIDGFLSNIIKLFSQNSEVLLTMAQEGHSPVLVFDSPVMVLHSPVMVLHSLVLVFTQSSFNFYTVQFYFFTQSSFNF